MGPAGEQQRAAHGGVRAGAPATQERPRRLARPGSRTLPRHLAADALRRRMLAAADALAVILALVLMVGLGAISVAEAFWAATLLPVWIVLAKLSGLYDRDHRALRHLTVDELGSIVTWATVCTAASIPVLALTPTGSLSAGAAVQLWLAVSLLTPVLRGLVRLMWRAWTPPATVLLIGSGPLERATRRKLELFGDIHMRVAGELDVDRLGSPQGRAPLEQQMREACAGDLPDRVIVCTENVLETVLADVVAVCRRWRIKLSVVPPLRGAFGTAVRLSHVAELPFVEYHTGDPSISTQALKRCVDVVVGAFALLLFAPVFLVSAAAIKLTTRGPVFYVQWRAGLEGHPFRMLKFRTMVDGAHKRLAEVVQIDTLPDPMFK